MFRHALDTGHGNWGMVASRVTTPVQRHTNNMKWLNILFLCVQTIAATNWYSATMQTDGSLETNEDSQLEILPNESKSTQSYDPWVFLKKIIDNESSDGKHVFKDNMKELVRTNYLINSKVTFPTSLQEPLDYMPWRLINKQARESSERRLLALPKKHRINNMNMSTICNGKKCLNQLMVPMNKKAKLGGNKMRFLELLQIVQFNHVSCTASNGLEGTCLHEYECQSRSGRGMGFCADGYGICCIALLQCGSHSTAKEAWFTSPEHPLPFLQRMSCAISLNKFSEDVQQIRLDFEAFELLPPTEGVCLDDQFTVSGHNLNNIVPVICGINTGQHVYIEVGQSDGPIFLSIQTIAPEARIFAIKITQLTAYDPLIAPTGCLQYFIQSQGYLKSYNYDEDSEVIGTKAASYFNNLNYAVCIERKSNICAIRYRNGGVMQIVNYDAVGLPILPPGQAGVEVFNCPTDWLLISATRLCGERLNNGGVIQDFSRDAPVTDNSAGPIVVWFRTDEVGVGRGFRLYYEQVTCPGPQLDKKLKLK